jgi:ADP-ribose pyrophosphatase YjhB (NUDIX family)
MVFNGEGRILLVRHTYTPGWAFPGGGVEFGETTLEALGRELAEEANVTLTGRPELFGIFSNASFFPVDHVVLYVVRQWRQTSMPVPNREISDVGFFDPGDLPTDTTAGTRRRIAEVSSGLAPSETW